MNRPRESVLQLTKRVCAALALIGAVAFIFSLFVSGNTSLYAMHAGIGILVASGFLFGGGLFLVALEEPTRSH